jgi:hypothetical protein
MPLSFIIVADGIEVVYETINFTNPEQFRVVVSTHNNPYFAEISELEISNSHNSKSLPILIG